MASLSLKPFALGSRVAKGLMAENNQETQLSLTNLAAGEKNGRRNWESDS